jgi:sulfatase maturation enzyme AslB (radical SAM superfamily)
LPFINQLEIIFINGNYGDFVMNPESLDIINWFKSVNPKLKFLISTNGGAKDNDFWKMLADNNTTVWFCIDGLADTHSIYRQNTMFHTIIKNAKTFINAGGRAIWRMTEFDHNLHQFEEAETLSKELGFVEFIRQPTNRNTGPIYDKQGRKIFIMRNDMKMPDKVDEVFAQYKKTVAIPDRHKIIDKTKKVTCKSLNRNSLYISAEGTIDPCCYLGIDKPDWPYWFNVSELRQDIFPTDLDTGIEWYNKVLNTINTENELPVCNQLCGK